MIPDAQAAAALESIAASLKNIEEMMARRLPPPVPPADEVLQTGECFRWRAHESGGGELTSLPSLPPDADPLADLLGLEDRIAALSDNTARFVAGKAANHALLTGGRGCGKSTIVRGVFAKYRAEGLRLIETDAEGLAQLPLLQACLSKRAEKYILYCDDLSFGGADDASRLFNRIKSAIDGALQSAGENLLVYATSNRRNIIAENFRDNLPTLDADGEIHPMETQDEKIALADRFGLWLSFYAPDAADYDAMVEHWLRRLGSAPNSATRHLARRFADQRGSRNGRIARQFAIQEIGKN